MYAHCIQIYIYIEPNRQSHPRPQSTISLNHIVYRERFLFFAQDIKTTNYVRENRMRFITSRVVIRYARLETTTLVNLRAIVFIA